MSRWRSARFHAVLARGAAACRQLASTSAWIEIENRSVDQEPPKCSRGSRDRHLPACVVGVSRPVFSSHCDSSCASEKSDPADRSRTVASRKNSRRIGGLRGEEERKKIEELLQELYVGARMKEDRLESSAEVVTFRGGCATLVKVRGSRCKVRPRDFYASEKNKVRGVMVAKREIVSVASRNK